MAAATKKTTTSRKKGITAEFVVDKDTKNTRRFSEVVDEEGDAVIGTLYIQKSAFSGNTLPDNITVTITAS